jgi:transposase
MRAHVSTSKNGLRTYYITDGVREGKKVSTKIVLALGSEAKLRAEGHEDPYAYAKQVAEKMTAEKNEQKLTATKKVDLAAKLPPEGRRSSLPITRNVGWLYIKEIWRRLGMDGILDRYQGKRQFSVRGLALTGTAMRIMDPCSKLRTLGLAGHYMGMETGTENDMIRLLSVLAENADDIQESLRENTGKEFGLSERNIFYDCTNFYCETEEEDEDLISDADGEILVWGMRRYGHSKENRPNPIIQMGLFTDGEGIPMSYGIWPGNTSEQTTAIPLESRMLDRWGMKGGFTYCADSGLASGQIRVFNRIRGGHYCVSQSLRKLKGEEWKLIRKDLNWRYFDDDRPVSIEKYRAACIKISEGRENELTDEEREMMKHEMVYKDYPYSRTVSMKGSGTGIDGEVKLSETLWVTFSKKYFLYEERIVSEQVGRAKEMLEKGVDPTRPSQNSPKNYTMTDYVSREGEVADKTRRVSQIDEEKVREQREYSGFYCCASDLPDVSVRDVIRITGNRWRIEYSFRVMKSHLRGRPMYVWTEDSIKGHFALCYYALLIGQLMLREINRGRKTKKEAKEDRKAGKATAGEPAFSLTETIDTLRVMDVTDISGVYWYSLYTGSELLSALEKRFPIGLDHEGFPMKRFGGTK